MDSNTQELRARMQQTLQNYFGYSSFRHQQQEIIETACRGQDSLVLMPTGGGKSVCYQVPALMLPGLTIVVSPLIALMKDQVDALRQNGIAAAFINSSMTAREQNQVMEELAHQRLRLLYLAPERLLGEGRFPDWLRRLPVSLIAIDEAHCISQWGHDFRPEYLALGRLKEYFPGVPVMALTATADQQTKEDILDKLALQEFRVFEHSFNRPNITYYVKPKTQVLRQIVAYLDAHPDHNGIIYCLSRAGAEELARQLQQEGFAAAAYHAGLSREEREQRQEQFLRDGLRIMVATIAFGMGINKSNVRFVMHADLPKNIEGYYQETGRAGRDGLKSNAILYFSSGDVAKMRSILKIPGNEAQTEILFRKLDHMARFCQTHSCRRQYLLNYFGESAPARCGNCDICLGGNPLEDPTVNAQKLLSAVARLEGRHDLNYTIRLLTGAAGVQAAHRKIKTFGIGRDQIHTYWQQLAAQLAEAGYLAQTQDGLLQLTAKSWPVLRGQEQLQLEEGRLRTSYIQQPDEPAFPELMQELKSLRKQLADEQDLPAYAVFTDASLHELATWLPLSLDELSRISGFGSKKLERYGEAFLTVIRKFAARKGLQSQMHNRTRREPAPARRQAGDTMEESLQLFERGLTLAEICRERRLTESTILSHLAGFVRSGRLSISRLVPRSQVALILQTIEQTGSRSLNVLKSRLEDDVDYGTLKLVLSHWEWMKEQ